MNDVACLCAWSSAAIWQHDDDDDDDDDEVTTNNNRLFINLNTETLFKITVALLHNWLIRLSAGRSQQIHCDSRSRYCLCNSVAAEWLSDSVSLFTGVASIWTDWNETGRSTCLRLPLLGHLCLVSTIPLPFCRCRCHLPLRRNRRSVAIESNPIFAVLP